MAEREVKFVLTAEDMATPVIEAFWKNIQQMQKDVNIGLNVQMQGTVNSSSTSSSSNPITPGMGPSTGTGDFSTLLKDAGIALKDFSSALKDAMSSIQGGKGQVLPQGVSKSEVAGEFSTINVGKRFKDLQRSTSPPEKKQDNAGLEKMLTTQNANMLRALGQYRVAWLSSLPKGSPMMGAAAGVVILQAVAEGIQKIVQILAEASPALRAEIKILKLAIGLFLKPIGDVLAGALRPLARLMIQTNARITQGLIAAGAKPGSEAYMKAYYQDLTDQFGKILMGGGLMESTYWQDKYEGQKPENDPGYKFADEFAEDWQRVMGYYDDNKIYHPGELIRFFQNPMNVSNDLTTSFTNLNSGVSSVAGLFTGLITPLTTISGILGVGKGDSGSGSSMSSTINMGGITINTSQASEAIEDIVDWGENAYDVARGYGGRLLKGFGIN